jgi:hypothetical protein
MVLLTYYLGVLYIILFVLVFLVASEIHLPTNVWKRALNLNFKNMLGIFNE